MLEQEKSKLAETQKIRREDVFLSPDSVRRFSETNGQRNYSPSLVFTEVSEDQN